MKKHWLFTTLLTILFCAICLTMLPIEAMAASASNLSYTLNSDGKSYTVSGCKDSASGKLTIPETYKGLPITGIRDRVFVGCDELTEIVVSDSVTTIGEFAFACDNLKNVTLGKGVSDVSSYTFAECLKLEGVWVSKNNPYYVSDENGVLFNKEKTKLVFAPRTISGSYKVPDSVTTIGGWAFGGCENLTNLTLPSGLETIENHAFIACRKMSINGIPDSVRFIDKQAFSHCAALESVTIPEGVTEIGELAFRGCTSLKSVKLPNSLKTINMGAFTKCTSLESMTIPRNVDTMKDDIFSDCSSLKEVRFTGDCPKWYWHIFPNVTATVYYPAGNETWTEENMELAGGNITWTPYTSTKITTQPKTAKVKVGATAKFTVKATGEGLKYQWQSSADGKTWKNCSSSSATKATFTFTSKTSHNGNYYRCRVTDSAGNKVYTSAVRLYVLGVTTQPKTQKTEAGETVKFTVKATGTGLKYQWQSSSDGKTWKNCSSASATSATFTFTGKSRHSSNYYRCRITDAAGNVVYTDAVRLYVLGITTQPTAKTVKAGATAKFTVKATGASKVYQWQVSTDGGKTWKNCVSSSATKATFTFTGKDRHDGNYYRCRVKDSGGNTVYSSKVKLTVK